jgi:type IV pilus assembly protein PilA
MKAMQKGFTLIELMIVVAIIGILAAIAIPAYQDYTIRSQVTEGLNLASAIKASVAEFYAQNGRWPTAIGPSTTAGTLGMDTNPSGKYVSGITVANGTIHIAYSSTAPFQANANLGGLFLDLRPTISGAAAATSNGDVVWTCGKHGIVGVDPTSGGATADATTVIAKYLPSNCRL